MSSIATSPESAEFIERKTCIACGSASLTQLSSGMFDDKPLVDFLTADPWGENPIPFLLGKRWSYVKCNECTQAFHKFILAPAWNERRFSKWMSQEAIEAFEQRLSSPERSFNKGVQNTKHILQLESLTRKIRNQGSLRLLDFGCGYGDFIALCGQFGIEAYGVDRSSARRENASSGKIFAELDQLGGIRFHVITMFEVLEHLDDPKSLLETLGKYLVKDGILVVETPDCSGISGIKTHDDYWRVHPLEHINGFTPTTLRKLVEGLGFEFVQKPVSHVTTDPVRVLKTEIKRVLGRAMSANTQQYFRKL